MDDELVVLVIEKGIITEVYSCNSNQKIVVVDKNNNSVAEFSWPETQFDDERVRELLGFRN